MRRITRVSAVLLVLSAAACGASTRQGGARGSGDILTTAEIDAAGYSDVYSVVQALKPQWLRGRGATSLSSSETVKVYLDGSLMGGPEHLRQITTNSISTVQFLDGLEATQRWGLDHGAGAIIVSTRGRPIRS